MELFGPYMTDLRDAFTERGTTVIILQVLLMVAAAIAAFFVHRYSHKTLSEHLQQDDIPLLRKLLLNAGQRLALPLSGLFAVLVGHLGFRAAGFETPLLDIIAQLLVALAVIRMIVYSLRMGIAPGPALKAWEKVISTGIWAIVALHLVGWLPAVESFMLRLASHRQEWGTLNRPSCLQTQASSAD